MDDEPALREADARVRAALIPDDAALRRVVMRALADDRAQPPGMRRALCAGFGAAALALIVGASAWQRHRSAPTTSSPSLAIIGRGSVVVVESQDGRRWVVGPPPERGTGGNYVIVVRE